MDGWTLFSLKGFFQAIAVLIVIFMMAAGGCSLYNESLRVLHNQRVQDCMKYDRFTLEECEFIVSTFEEGD
jgi:hypothetical protein